VYRSPLTAALTVAMAVAVAVAVAVKQVQTQFTATAAAPPKQKNFTASGADGAVYGNLSKITFVSF